MDHSHSMLNQQKLIMPPIKFHTIGPKIFGICVIKQLLLKKKNFAKRVSHPNNAIDFEGPGVHFAVCREKWKTQ